METLAAISLYSVLMLVGLGIVSATFVFLGVWLSDQSDDQDAH